MHTMLTVTEDLVKTLPEHFSYVKNKHVFNLFEEVGTIGSKFWFDDYIIKRYGK